MGILSLSAVVCVLVLAISTRRTLFAMLTGLTVGTIVVSVSLHVNPVDQFVGYLYTAMSDDDLHWMLLLVSSFGIFVTLLERSHAVRDFGVWAGQFVKSKRASLLGTFFLSLLIFMDDYLINLTVGTTMKEITDRQGVPRTQLGYIVNSSAAPICVLIPLSSWAAYFGALLESQGITGPAGTGLSAYISGLPYMYYGYFAIAVVLLVCLGILPPMGKIKKDTESLQKEREAERLKMQEEAAAHAQEQTMSGAESESPIAWEDTCKQKVSPWNFLIPVFGLILVTVVTGGDILKGAGTGFLTAMVWYLIQKKFTFKELCDLTVEGIMSMSFAMILIVLAFAIRTINVDLGLADYIISVAAPIMKGAFLPAVVFIVCASYSYASGCFWDMAAIMMPLVVPLAKAMGVDPILASMAVFSGAAFGSNTCLYGDSIILCAKSVKIQAVDLMMATLPYALIAGGFSFIAFLITGCVMYL